MGLKYVIETIANGFLVTTHDAESARVAYVTSQNFFPTIDQLCEFIQEQHRTKTGE